MNFIKTLVIVILAIFIPVNSGNTQTESRHYTYKLSPDNTYVDNVTYDPALNVIRINVHAVVGFGFIKININEWYGIEVKDPSNVDLKIKQILGEVKIVHLSQWAK